MPAPAGVEIRLYRDSDYATVTSFKCADPRRPWTREAELVIRKAPDDIRSPDDKAQLVVAVDDGRIVGAIVFGIDPQHQMTRSIFTIGVVRDRRREHIGISLKRAALAELVATGYVGPVYSQVHRYNTPMRELNDQLLAETTKDPDAGKYLLTVVRPAPTP